MLRRPARDAAGELLAGLAGFGACGFHTERWESAFRPPSPTPSWPRRPGAGAPPTTFVAPLGPDADALAAERRRPATWPPSGAERLDQTGGRRRLVLRVDRVELSKNLLRGFLAFEELLETRPEWRGRVVLVALAYPSRQNLADYLGYRTEVEHTVTRINERFGTPSGRRSSSTWPTTSPGRGRPLSYDVLLVNPVRDGMNMVAKEGPLLNERDGVLVLSREAGAWDELRPGSLGTNPFDVTGTADALEVALTMAPGERAGRAEVLRAAIGARTAQDWLDDQLDAARR